MKANQPLLLLCALIALGVGGYALWHHPAARSRPPRTRKILCYQDSMHPWIKSDGPGKCTICAMDLTPVHEGEKGFDLDDNLVVLNSNSITVLNVQTEEVKRQPLAHTLRVAGTLEANETRKTIVSAPTAGRISPPHPRLQTWQRLGTRSRRYTGEEETRCVRI